MSSQSSTLGPNGWEIDAPNEQIVTASTTLTGGIELTAGGTVIEVGSGGTQSTSARIVLAVGQSNAMGKVNLDSLIDVFGDDVYQFGCTSSSGTRYQKIFSGADPLHWAEGIATGLNSPANWFAKSYAKMTGSPVIIVPAAFGATAMVGSRWQPGTPGGDLYENAISQANLAITAATAMFGGATFDGIYWIQGEADGDAAVSQATYESNMALLIDGFRSRITGAAQSWFITGSMPYETMQYYAGTIPIHLAQKKVCAEKVRAIFVDGPRGYTVSPGANRHYTADGVRIIGIAMADATTEAKAKAVAGSISALSPVQNLTASAITTSGLTLTWTHNDAVYYVVQHQTGGGAWTTVTRLFSDVATQDITGLSAGTAYNFRVKAINSLGEAVAELAASTSSAGGSAPVNTAIPAITGSAVEGQTLTASTGTWSNTPTAYSYQWKRAGANIAGATSSTYLLVTADVGNTITVTVTATNASGSASATSSATSAVGAAPSGVTYDFTADTVGAAPAGVTATTGSFVVGVSGISGMAGQNAHTTASVAADVACFASLTNCSSAANQRITWKRAISASGPRDGFMLRTQAAAAGGVYGAAKQGYWFAYNAASSRVDVYKLLAGGSTAIQNVTSVTDSDARYMRATVNGSAIMFETSPDGSAWTTRVNTTDTDISASGGVSYFNGAGGSSPNAAWVDDIFYEVLP